MLNRREVIRNIGRGICAGAVVPFFPSLLGPKLYYHVANPDVGCFMAEDLNVPGDYAMVNFESPVSFSGNPDRGLETNWGVCQKLLFDSPEEARKHDFG